MLAKVGRSRSMLICTDCGHPQERSQDPEQSRQRMVGGLMMIGLATVAGMTFFLSQVSEQRAKQMEPLNAIEAGQGLPAAE